MRAHRTQRVPRSELELLARGQLLAFLCILALLIVSTIGWVMNVFRLSHCDFEKPYQTEVVRVVGVIVPVVGAVYGYVGNPESESAKPEAKP